MHRCFSGFSIIGGHSEVMIRRPKVDAACGLGGGRWVCLLWMVILRATCLAQLDTNLPERPHQWNAFGTNISYGLVDLDNFPSGGYGYCKWGNWLDDGSGGTFNLAFNWLTRGPYTNVANQDRLDLFLSPSDTSL